MDSKTKFSRRHLLGILVAALSIPAVAIKNTDADHKHDVEYDTLLKPDGSVVKVPKHLVKNSKVLNKNVSNRKLLNWLGKTK